MRFAALWLAAFVTAAVVGTHGIAYWDAGDYVRLAITGGESGLLLGRPLFLLASRTVLALGVDPAHAEVVLRWFWTVVGTSAAPLLALLAARLGADRRSSFVAGLFLALSPSFAHTSHQVLTDAPALALSIAALCVAAERQAIAAGLMIAAAIATRETAVIHAVAIALLCGRRAWVALLTAGAALGFIVVLFRPPSMGTWIGAMSSSAAANPLSLRDIGLALVWVLAAGPAPVIGGILALAWGGLARAVRVVAWPAAIASIALLFYPDGSFSPRYVLATIPLAFFIPAAAWFKDHTRVLAIALAVPIVVAMFAAREANRVAAYGATLSSRISALPQNALVVPGHFCPQARLAATVHGRQDLTFVCPGWEWPVDVASLLDRAAAGGAPIAVDASPDAWIGARELPLRDRVCAWLNRRAFRELAGFSVIGG